MFGYEEGFVARFRGKVQNWWSRDKTPEYREMAVLRSFPRWEGFSVVDEEMEEMTATEAIERLKRAIYCLSRIVLEEYGYQYLIKLSVEKVRGSAKSYVVCLFEQVEVLAAIKLMWTCYTHLYIRKGQPVQVVLTRKS